MKCVSFRGNLILEKSDIWFFILNRILFIFISGLPKTTIDMITDMETSFFWMLAKIGENKGMIKFKQFRSYAENIFFMILVLVKI